MANLVGSQTVHLAATVNGVQGATVGAGPFPLCGAITAGDPFPQSPTPAFLLIAANIVGGPYLYTPGAYVKGQTAIDVQYFTGAMRQTSTIIVTESVATVNAGWS